MRINKWSISNLDASQKKVLESDIDTNIIVQGGAGSGKTNLAIYRALQAKDKGSYIIVALTISLKRMISYGLKTLGLNPERAVYDWAWLNRGIDLEGEVYAHAQSKETLYLVKDGDVREFTDISSMDEKDLEEKDLEEEDLEEEEQIYGLDFNDFVEDSLFQTFGRRRSFFVETTTEESLDQFEAGNSELIPAGVIYQKIQKADYIIVDEAQDFKLDDYTDSFIPNTQKAISIFGDSMQNLNSKGASIERISKELNLTPLTLEHNYRLPKTIAKVAQKIARGQNEEIDLVTTSLKDNGNTDYPNYPKPQLLKFSTFEDELDWIISKIQTEDLDDVAIILAHNSQTKPVYEYLKAKGLDTQVLYRTGTTPPFQTINTLDFTNNDTPCLLNSFESKGLEFEHVFIPGCTTAHQFKSLSTVPTHTISMVESLPDGRLVLTEGQTPKGFSSSFNGKALYVACTRSSRNLYFTYSGKLSVHLAGISKEDLDIIDTTNTPTM